MIHFEKVCPAEIICAILAMTALLLLVFMITIALLEKHGAFEKCLERNPAKECAYLQ